MASQLNQTLAIRLLAQYLSSSIVGRHSDLIRAEFIDLLSTVEIDKDVARTVVTSGDPDLIRQVVLQPGGVGLECITDIDGDPVDVFRTVVFDNIPAHNRIELFDLLRPHTRMEDLPLASILVGQAVRAKDGKFLHHILSTFPDVDRHILMLETHITQQLLPAPVDVWSEVFEKIDLSRFEVTTFAQDAVRRQSTHGVALLLRAGYPLKPVLEAHKVSGNPWPVRLLRRLQSAHGQMSLLATLPSMAEISAMDEKALQLLLAGPSPKELKAAEKRRKHQEWLAKQGDEATPEARKTTPDGPTSSG